MIFTWNNVGYLNSDHAVVLSSIPLYAQYSDKDVQDIKMLWLDFEFIDVNNV